MLNEKFEWDDAKALANNANHGVEFESAVAAFGDVFGLGFLDDRENYREERWIRLGMVNGVLLVVVYTERNGRKRIISARRAVKTELDFYYQQNSTV